MKTICYTCKYHYVDENMRSCCGHDVRRCDDPVPVGFGCKEWLDDYVYRDDCEYAYWEKRNKKTEGSAR